MRTNKQKKMINRRDMYRMILGVFGIIVCFLTIRFCSVEREAQTRFANYREKAKVVDTSYGKVSYIDEGQGEVILSCHGICGGYDQAYDTLKNHVHDFRIIAPSRFGYPGSDMPKNATVEMQAEAFRELLDQLNIEKTYVLATSAGGASAIKFALMYPERTKGLILYCSGYPALEQPEKKLSYAGPPAGVCNDFCMWLISPLFKPVMGMETETIKVILPLKERKQGILFDAAVTNTVMVNDYTSYDMSELEIPVLVIHAKDDKMADYQLVEPWTKRIQDCRLVSLESGGHLMTGNSEKINQALE